MDNLHFPKTFLLMRKKEKTRKRKNKDKNQKKGRVIINVKNLSFGETTFKFNKR